MSKIGIVNCPKCEKTTHQHKIGKTKAGSQRYRCYFCGRSYTPKKDSARVILQIGSSVSSHLQYGGYANSMGVGGKTIVNRRWSLG